MDGGTEKAELKRLALFRVKRRFHMQCNHRRPMSSPGGLSSPVFLLLIALLEQGAASRHWMRPLPSQDLPVMDLIEPPDKRYDPKPEDLDPKVLKEKMGKNFDREFMSETQPLESKLRPNGTVEFSFRRTKQGKVVPASKMPKEIRHLRLHSLKLPDGSKIRMKVGKKMRRKFKQLLWFYTYCPVAYRWKDLGVRFFPRWIKEGSCMTLGSCSFPSGMTCKPHRFVTKMFLRWHCQDWIKKKLCKWISVSYPIITQCSCRC